MYCFIRRHGDSFNDGFQLLLSLLLLYFFAIIGKEIVQDSPRVLCSSS